MPELQLPAEIDTTFLVSDLWEAIAIALTATEPAVAIDLLAKGVRNALGKAEANAKPETAEIDRLRAYLRTGR